MSDPITAAGGAANAVVPKAQPQSVPPGIKAPKGDPGGTVPGLDPGAVRQDTAPAAGRKTALVPESAMTQVREFLKTLPPEIHFSEDRASGHVVFKVINPVTHEVIRQFPPEEILTLARRLKSLQEGKAGVLVDEQL